MNLSNAPIPQEGFVVTHFLTVKDQARSREFYSGILGGKVLTPENPCIIKLANSWIILNAGGGPTPDKPDIILDDGLILLMEFFSSNKIVIRNFNYLKPSLEQVYLKYVMEEPTK